MSDSESDHVIPLGREPDGSFRRQRPDDAPPKEVAQPLHEISIDGLTYDVLANPLVGDHPTEHSLDYVDQYLQELGPRDSVERMLAMQMLWQHVRLARLCRIGTRETRVDVLKAINAAIDSGMSVSARQAAAWDRIRRPRPVQFFRGNQVNVAEQQVVAQSRNGADSRSTDGANEQGSHNEQEAAPALQAHSCWTGVAQGFERPHEAVGAEHRPADA